MKKNTSIVKKTALGFLLVAFAIGSFGVYKNQTARAATTWDTTGNYVINLNYLGTDYSHDMSLVQDDSNNLTGSGGSPAGTNTYTWVITSGGVTDSTIDFFAHYTATPDAVTPQTIMHVTGKISDDGKISGVWSDNYSDGERSGTFTTHSGAAVHEPVPTNDTAPINGSAPPTVKVTVKKYVDGYMATPTSANNTDFPMNSTWNSVNLGPGSGTYSLSESGYNGNPTPYQAITSEMTSGASYTTSENTSTGIVGTSCTVEGTPYALIGYTYGNTWAEAQAQTPSLVAPSFTNMKTDKFVIVHNDNCATDEVGGGLEGDVVPNNGELKVTSIEMLDTSATANNQYEDGWKYVFNITVPSHEPDISMKFANWIRTGGSETIPAGNNMRISSSQANNAGATVMITAADTYSTPALTMVTDLNPALDGIQVKVLVEVKIPIDTTNGTYTTSYGVRSE